MKLLSIIIPVYNESEGLSMLISRLDGAIDSMKHLVNTEVLLVDDHSTDDTPTKLRQLLANKPGYKFIRLSRNMGSHVATVAGYTHCKGDSAIFMAGDLQDPPELIPSMVEKWQEGFDVVWAVRSEHQGVSFISRIFSRGFYWLLGKMTNLYIPKKGADYALLDRKVYMGLIQSSGSKPSLGAFIAWLGFKQTEILYVKESRKFGKSKWTLSKKLNGFADAFVGFSYLPMRLMSLVGGVAAISGFIYAIFVIIMRFYVEHPIEGWSSLMVIVLIIGGLQMLMLGVLGEYIWRNLEESRKRPLFLIEEQYGIEE